LNLLNKIAILRILSSVKAFLTLAMLNCSKYSIMMVRSGPRNLILMVQSGPRTRNFMAGTQSQIVMLTTPCGHEVRAELDFDDFAVRHAKVVHNYTGVMKPLDGATTETLARALKAKQVYEHAMAETSAVEETLKGFGKLAAPRD
jgi:hypothetical protein